MSYIDAHVHVWTADTERYPLVPGYAREQVRPPSFAPEELFAHCRPSGVERIVLIQMSFYRSDNSYMLDCIANWPGVFRGVAVVNHTDAALGENLERLRQGGVRGIRVYQRGDDPRSRLDEAEYAELNRLAGELGIAVCPLMDPEALPNVARAAAAFPHTTFVIDHLARIGARGCIEEAQVEELCGLARWPNVSVKVSAFYALGKKRPPHDDLVPTIQRVWEAFGTERLMWASDCPFQVVSESYEDSISVIRDARLTPFLTDADRDMILAGTAERVFWAD